MRGVNLFAAAASLGLSLIAGLAFPASAQVTAFEGARVIQETAARRSRTLHCSSTARRIVQVGPSASVQVPAGARRVSIAGKTVMPMIIDTHNHLSRHVRNS